MVIAHISKTYMKPFSKPTKLEAFRKFKFKLRFNKV